MHARRPAFFPRRYDQTHSRGLDGALECIAVFFISDTVTRPANDRDANCQRGEVGTVLFCCHVATIAQGQDWNGNAPSVTLQLAKGEFEINQYDAKVANVHVYCGCTNLPQIPPVLYAHWSESAGTHASIVRTLSLQLRSKETVAKPLAVTT